MLENCGYQVKTAADSRDGLRRVIEFAPQIVISDWKMPEMDGLSMCRAIRATEEGESIYLVLLTAQENEDILVEAFDAGVDDYIVKPFSPRVLKARLHAGERITRLHEALARKELDLRGVVADLALTVRQLHELSMKDPLTHLANRRYGLERLEQEWALAHRHQEKTLSVLMIDIDRFKRINDQFGHDQGDSVLKLVAGILDRAVRTGDLPCRLGGEEFLVICPDTDLKAAKSLAERIREFIQQDSLPLPSGRMQVTVSIGVSEFQPGMACPAELVRRSDEAMYMAKNSGRNRVVAMAGDAPPFSVR